MSITLYNTLTKKKEPFSPVDGKRVGMYVCGVTVYDMCHIGHARSLVVFDVIARFLRRKGYELTYVRNFTDVDDKIIARANQLGADYREVAERYIREFNTDMEAIRVKPADIEPRATEHIGKIIEMIRRLEEKGLAYPAQDGSVYFDVSGFKEYGKLSGRDTEEMIAGARVEIDENKKNPLDFALWKSSKEGEPWWESPWSKGRPGWHIECSAMSTHLLGPSIDIHGGGRDLVFPHHENEIAQSEGTYGVEFVKYWVHNGFVTVGGEKMSKSLGNFLTIRELLKDVNTEVLRLLLLSHHYRSPIDFSRDAIQAASQGLVRFYEMLDRVAGTTASSASPRLAPLAKSFEKDFDEAMSDDFNTARAVARLHELTTEVNRALDENPAVSAEDHAAMRSAVALASEVLGFLEEEPREFLDRIKRSGLGETGLSENEIEDLIAERNAARKARDFGRADEIRDTLKARGIQLKDSPQGTSWERITA